MPIDTFAEEEDYLNFLEAKNPAFGGRRPRILLKTREGRKAVKRCLLSIQWGIFA